MDLFEAIEKRASVRAFVPVEVPEGDLLKIADAGRRAPSGGNRQPLQFIIVREPETLKALARVQACFATASAAIGIIADPAVSRWWLEDAAAAAENMLLAIHGPRLRLGVGRGNAAEGRGLREAAAGRPGREAVHHPPARSARRRRRRRRPTASRWKRSCGARSTGKK